ncbi:MAG: fibronectin type III domain-containing protein [Sedimentisphaerales bacterium]|nr:fibronectin type III domain-containing protein [Sedimentisphaerales bacterium]
MATYPKTESGLVALAQEILNGVAAHPTLFPSVTTTELQLAVQYYNQALKTAQASKAEAQKDTELKNDARHELDVLTKKAVKAAESDCVDNPGNLVFIGWGGKAPPTPIAAPGAPTNLRSTDEGFGTVVFAWDKPRTGGTVRNYSLYRTTADPESGLAQWSLVGFYYSNEITVENQPRGTQLYYMVNAANAGGTGPNSNTLPVVL